MQLFAHLPYSADPNSYYPAEKKSTLPSAFLDVDGILRPDGSISETRPVALQPEASAYREATLCLFSRCVVRLCMYRSHPDRYTVVPSVA
jgi:hypothetical protein